MTAEAEHSASEPPNAAGWLMKLSRMMLLILAVSLIMVAPWHLESAYRAMVDSTVYSPGYSEEDFNAVASGMNLRAVERLLGRPFRASEGADGQRLVYSRTESDDSYYLRIVVLDKHGIVIRTVSDWYQD